MKPANLCRGCGCDFASVSAFDRHRSGRHEFSFREGLAMEPPREDGRRCLDLDEFEGAGLGLDRKGRWSITEDAERARRRFRPDAETAVGAAANARDARRAVGAAPGKGRA